tara:strand:- start:843 stop:1019 length:177 start_codon:yes stop_codon:yes gene_type:complete
VTSELNGPEASRKMAKLLNKNYLTTDQWDEVLIAAGKCKNWDEVLIRYEEITGKDSGR